MLVGASVVVVVDGTLVYNDDVLSWTCSPKCGTALGGTAGADVVATEGSSDVVEELAAWSCDGDHDGIELGDSAVAVLKEDGVAPSTTKRTFCCLVSCRGLFAFFSTLSSEAVFCLGVY